MRSAARFRGRFGLAAVLVVVGVLASLGLASAASAGGGAKLTIAPTSKNFGSVVADGTNFSGPQTFTVSNTGSAASGNLTITLSGANAVDFTKAPGSTGTPCDLSGATPLAAGASCTIDVKFVPAATASGNRTAKLNVSATPGGGVSASLSGLALNAVLTISPASWNFGNVAVGTPAGPQTFTVTNTGSGTSGNLTITMSGSTDFADAPGSTGTPCDLSGVTFTTLGPGLSCTIDVTFTPTVAGNESAKLNVSASPGGNVSASLSGTGVTAKLAISPTSWNFGSVVAGGTSGAQTFTLSNVGGAPSGPITPTLTPSPPTDFTFDVSGGTACSGAVLAAGLPAGASCTFDAYFTPLTTTSGKVTQKVAFSASPGGSVTTTLTGTALNAVLSISPSSYNFDSVAVNGGSVTSTFTVNNIGSATSGTITFSKSGGAAGDYTIAAGSSGTPCLVDGTQTLAAGSNCTIDITFDPSAGGNRNATVSATASPGGTASTSLTGTGTIAKLTISPGKYNFGNVPAGNSPVTTFTVTNNGTAPTSVGGINWSTSGSGEFVPASGASNGCVAASTVLPVGGSCTIDVTWNSTAPTGKKQATLNVFVVGAANEGTPHADLVGTTT